MILRFCQHYLKNILKDFTQIWHKPTLIYRSKVTVTLHFMRLQYSMLFGQCGRGIRNTDMVYTFLNLVQLNFLNAPYLFNSVGRKEEKPLVPIKIHLYPFFFVYLSVHHQSPLLTKFSQLKTELSNNYMTPFSIFI